MTQTSGAFYCSECSRAAGEQLFGTAPPADVWILLEYPALWGKNTPDDSDLSPEIKAHIKSWTTAIPNTKFAFIRQKETRISDSAIRLYVARVLEIAPELYRVDLDSYGDLLTVDMPGLALGDAEAALHLTDESLYLVCNNGRRDVSCAKYGVPLFERMRQHAPSNVWASTHIGGHRFAATMVSLPDGVTYGFVDPDDAEGLIADLHDGRVRLDKLRGRTCYNGAVQAADYFLRRDQNITDLPGVRLVGMNSDNGLHTVRLEVLRSGLAMTVTMKTVMSEFEIFRDSDGTGEQVAQFELVDIALVI